MTVSEIKLGIKMTDFCPFAQIAEIEWLLHKLDSTFIPCGITVVPGILTKEQSPVNYLWNFINMKYFHFPLLILLIWQTKPTPLKHYHGLCNTSLRLIPPLSPIAHLHSNHLVCGLCGVLCDFNGRGKRVSVWKEPRFTSWSGLCQGSSLFWGGRTPPWVGVVPAFMSLWQWLEQHHSLG